MTRSRRPTKTTHATRPGDGCWLCQGRKMGSLQMQVEADQRAEREALRRAVETELCPHEVEFVDGGKK